jgi:UDP-N-acetylmuramate: L-alanyl-gamma-D-glutamyl-meso-diaminopimelate ligase
LLNGDDPNLLALPDAPWTTMISVGQGEANDLRIADFEEDAEGSRFRLLWRGEEVQVVEWSMPGLFNARNVAMAFLSTVLAQAEEPDLDDLFAQAALPDFSACQGVKRRQEILVDKESRVVLSDFGHHPTAIEGTLQSLRARWPGRRIVACFEPRSNPAVTNVFQDRFADALSLADVALLGAVHRSEKIPEDKRIDPGAMINRVENAGKQGRAFAQNSELADYLETQLDDRPTLVVFFSNGSFDGVIDRFAKFAS